MTEKKKYKIEGNKQRGYYITNDSNNRISLKYKRKGMAIKRLKELKSKETEYESN